MDKNLGAGSRIAIVTVHGTGDTAEGPDGEKWFQRGSHFAEALKQRLSGRGVEAELVPFLWSGANSTFEREKAAESLAAAVKRMTPKYSGVHLIAHSHGGNVANGAALLLRWGRQKQRAQEKIASLTTIGTPFLNSRSSAMQSMGGLMFLGVTLASVPLYLISTLLLLLWILGVADPLEISKGLGALSDHGWLIFWSCTLAVGIPLWQMLRLALRRWRHIIRPRSAAGAHASVFSVWHANDEAISFLQQIEGLPLEPFPLGSVLRGSRGAATSAGVLAVVVGALSPAIILLANLFGWIAAPWASPYWFWTSTLTILFATPLLFAAIYLLLRLIAGSAGEVVARPRLNNWIAGVLRGIAFGKDSDQAIGEVNTKSHTHMTKEHKIEGPVAQRMQANAEAAAAKLIERYRWALFTVGADTNGPLANLATDAMTWSSLIHTTYFDQPEVVDLIADYIADQIGAPASAVSAAAAAIAQDALTSAPASAPSLAAAARSPPAAAAAKAAPPRARGSGVLAWVGFGVVAAVSAASILLWQRPDLLGPPSAKVTPIEVAEIEAEAIVALAPGAAATPFRDCDACPEMRRLDRGIFLMGASSDDPGRRPWEEPRHEVTVPAFAIGVREVTFSEWGACVVEGGCNSIEPPDPDLDSGARPVNMVSWRDAQVYVRWLSQRTGRAYRLPSEAEWEFAARAGSSTRYWWGDGFEPNRTPRGSTAAAGAFPANRFGLYDVTGNVGEWVEDCYVNNYAAAPRDGKPLLLGNCTRRVVRGGSWREGPSGLRIASRSRIDQNVRDASIGFRVAAQAPL